MVDVVPEAEVQRQLVVDASCALSTRVKLQDLLARAAAEDGFATGPLSAIADMVTSGQVGSAEEALVRLRVDQPPRSGSG